MSPPFFAHRRIDIPAGLSLDEAFALALGAARYNQAMMGDPVEIVFRFNGHDYTLSLNIPYGDNRQLR